MVTSAEETRDESGASTQTGVAELFERLALNERDENQCNEATGSYNRDFMHNVRDFEKIFQTTACPLDAEKRRNLGVCRTLIGAKKKSNQGGFLKKTERRTAGRWEPKHDEVANAEETAREPVAKPIKPLHRTERPWKKCERTKKQETIANVISILNKITPVNEDALTKEFLALKVYASPRLKEVVKIIFDKVRADTQYRASYARLCFKQVEQELKLNDNVSEFRNALLARAQTAFSDVSFDGKQVQFSAIDVGIRQGKFNDTMFIGHLHLVKLISVRVIVFCVYQLLSSVTRSHLDGVTVDEQAVECVVKLLELIGSRLDADDALAASAARPPGMMQAQPALIVNSTISMLEAALRLVRSHRLRFLIKGIVELRANGWVERRIVVDGVSKCVEEIKQDIDVERIMRAAKKRLDNEKNQLKQREEMKREKKAQRALVRNLSTNDPDIHASSSAQNERSSYARNAEETERTESEQIKMLAAHCRHLSGQVNEWKGKHDEMERKYHKLLMMVGREKQSND